MNDLTGPDELPDCGSRHLGLELRHLRYLVAVADAGTFTHAAERMFIASRRSASRSGGWRAGRPSSASSYRARQCRHSRRRLVRRKIVVSHGR